MTQPNLEQYRWTQTLGTKWHLVENYGHGDMTLCGHQGRWGGGARLEPGAMVVGISPHAFCTNCTKAQAKLEGQS